MPPVIQGITHWDRALTNVSVMYRNETYFGGSIFPTCPVNKRSDKYFQYSRADFLGKSGIDTNGKAYSLRRPDSEAAEIQYGQSSGNFYADEFALRELVTDAVVKYADMPLQPEIDTTVHLTERLTIDNETMVAAQSMKRANFNSLNKVVLTTGAIGTSWGSGSYASPNSDPFINIKNGRLAVNLGIAKNPNSIALSIGTARALADHPKIKDLVKYTNPEALTLEGLPTILRGLRTMECSAQANTAAEGAPNYLGGYIWVADDGTDAALIFYNNAMPSIKSVAFGYTFEAPDDTTNVRGFSIRKWREEKRKGMMVECSFLRDYKFIGVDGSNLSVGGYLISSATV